MKDDILKQAEHTLNLQECRAALKELKDFIPEIAQLTKLVYTEYKKAGFSTRQAFELAKEYTMAMLFMNK
jgi:hypothetical protein